MARVRGIRLAQGAALCGLVVLSSFGMESSARAERFHATPAQRARQQASNRRGQTSRPATPSSSRPRPPRRPSPTSSEIDWFPNESPGLGGAFALTLGSFQDPERMDGTERSYGITLGAPVLNAEHIALHTNLELGTTSDWNLQYALRFLFGFGLGTESSSLALMAGGGLSHITGGRQPFALEVPVELYGGLNLTRSIRLEAWARGSWLFLTEATREDSSELIPLFDELTLGGAVAWSDRDEEPGFFLGAEYRELMGTQQVLLIVGLALAQDNL